MYILADLKLDDGQSVAVLTVPPKEFKTGSRGFFGSTKAEINGKRYQIQIQVVEIGSKNTPDHADLVLQFIVMSRIDLHFMEEKCTSLPI